MDKFKPLQQHFTVKEVADAWKLDPTTVRRIFIDEEGVLKIGNPTARGGKRSYVTLRIPFQVLCACTNAGWDSNMAPPNPTSGRSTGPPGEANRSTKTFGPRQWPLELPTLEVRAAEGALIGHIRREVFHANLESLEPCGELVANRWKVYFRLLPGVDLPGSMMHFPALRSGRGWKQDARHAKTGHTGSIRSVFRNPN